MTEGCRAPALGMAAWLEKTLVLFPAFFCALYTKSLWLISGLVLVGEACNGPSPACMLRQLSCPRCTALPSGFPFLEHPRCLPAPMAGSARLVNYAIGWLERRVAKESALLPSVQ